MENQTGRSGILIHWTLLCNDPELHWKVSSIIEHSIGPICRNITANYSIHHLWN